MQLLEQKGGLPGIACNVGRPSSNILYQFHRLMCHVPLSPVIIIIIIIISRSRSAAERFLFPVLKRGTNYRKKSPLRHLYLPSNVTSRHFYLGNHFRTILLIDTLVDLVVI